MSYEFNKNQLCQQKIILRTGSMTSIKKYSHRQSNEVYQDPMLWWLSPEVQEVRKRFCRQFARTSSTWVSDWKKELFRIAKK